MKKAFNFYLVMLLAVSLVLVISSCNKDEENGVPTISAVTVNPASVAANGITTVTVMASDPDGDALSYAYIVTGGAIAPNGASASWTAPAQAGAYSVTVTVSDGNGGQISSNGALTVTSAVTQGTQVTGTVNFPAGTSGDLSNAKVSLYTSYENWNNNQPIKFGAVTGSGSSVSFTITGVNPGNYYLDVWKDNDNDGTWSTGDFVGWYGEGGLGSPSLTEFQIVEGQTFNITGLMYIY